MKPILIDVTHPNWYHAIFYALAFFVSFIILVSEGHRRKIPSLPWLIVIATGFLAFVLGCRLVTFSSDDWNLILSNQPLGHTTGIVMLGGLLVCVPLILVTKRVVGLNDSVLDAYAFVLPVGMCLQRIGCLLSGCCFGSTTTGWGVQYGRETPVFYDHLNESLIADTSLHSLAVHPVQLYESLGCVAVVILLLKTRRRFNSQGSIFYLSGLYYYMLRFLTEFFRDANAHAIDTPTWWGLNTVQWTMFALIGASIFIIAVKERSAHRIPDQKGRHIRVKHIVYLSVVFVVFSIASKWLSPAEKFVVYIVLFAAAAYLLVGFFKFITMPGFRIATLSLIILSPIIMCQTSPEQAGSDTTRISYNVISIGGLMGTQDLTMVNSCASESSEYENKYRLLGMGFSRTVQTGKEKSHTMGLSTFLGTHDEKVAGMYAGDRPPLTSYSITPYGQLDYPAFGVGLGVHVGDMSLISTDPTATSIKRYSVFPQGYLRFGHLNRFFGELSWARSFPSSFPGNVFQANLGFSLKRNMLNSGVFRFGTSSSTGIFLTASFPAGKHVVIEPYLGFLASPIMALQGYDDNSGTLGSLSLHYKFARRAIP